jgi:transcription termination factor Rho
VTDTQDTTTTAPAKKTAKKSGGLNTMLLADLKSMADGLGIKGTGSMKKAQLVDAIKSHQSGQSGGGPSARRDETQPERRPEREQEPQSEREQQREPRQERQEGQPRQTRARQERKSEDTKSDDGSDEDRSTGSQNQNRQQNQQRNQNRQGGQGGQGGNQGGQQNQQRNQNQQTKQTQQDRQNQQDRQSQQDRQNQQQDRQDDQNDQGDGQDDGEGEGGRRNRRRRGRDRDRTRTGGRNEPDTTILEDDVLVPAAGILDVLDNYAFVRTSGYLAGPDDVYLSLSMVRKYALRRGDAIVGQVRQPREGERKEKFNPMVRIDSVNGTDPDSAKHRGEFSELTPVHPQQRLRLETGPDNLIGRVIDIVTPVGKGQRGVIIAPAQAGKTTIVQSVATSITANNPECHLMVVLVDERPEEVTDFERAVKGEVIASTFDQAPADHTTVAELAVERAKRLVELGHDVVVLVDGLSRLGRAYNVVGPTSGRTLAGGVDASALTATKRLFGAARSLESGGSLTILATVLVDTGSTVDDLLVEELTGTESLVLRLDGDLAEERVFPAVDLGRSGTRHEVELVGAQEHAVLDKLRRGLTGERGRGLAGLLERLHATQTNYELLSATQRSS